MYHIVLLAIITGLFLFMSGYYLALGRIRQLELDKGDLEDDLRRARVAIQQNEGVPSQNHIPTVSDLVRLGKTIDSTILENPTSALQLSSIRRFNEKMDGNLFYDGEAVESHSFKKVELAYKSTFPIDPSFAEHLQKRLGTSCRDGQVRICVEEGQRGGVDVVLRSHPFVYNGPVLITMCDLDGELGDYIMDEANKIIYEDNLHQMPSTLSDALKLETGKRTP